MSIIDKLASNVGTRKDQPNRKVAELCVNKPDYFEQVRDTMLNPPSKPVQGDCAEVFAEAAKIKPELVARYVDSLLSMLHTKNNRALWESLAAISSVSEFEADKIYEFKDRLLQLAETGSVIVVDGAVSTLAKVTEQNSIYNEEIFPKLLNILLECIPRDIPRMAEYIRPAVRANKVFKGQYREVLERRLPECKNKAAENRVKKLLETL